MKVHELAEQLNILVAEGFADLDVMAAKDEEGNGYHGVFDVETRHFNTEHVEEYGWSEDIPEEDVVIIW